MNQPLTRRETQLLKILPAVLIVCAYGFFFDRPHRSTIEGLRKSVETARQNAVSENQLRAGKERIALLKEQIKIEQHRAPSLILPARWTSPKGRLDALARMSSVFDAHDLFIVSLSRVADAATSSTAPKQLQEFAASVARDGHSPVPEMWRADVLGSYAEVVAALWAMDRSNAFIVPMGVSMEPIGEGTNYRKWSLWFWV